MMRSSRGMGEASRYKILFIIAVLMTAISGMMYVLKWKEVAALYEGLEEVQREAEDTEGALNKKVSELEQRLESQFAWSKEVQTHLKKCQDELLASKNHTSTLETSLGKSKVDITSLKSEKESVEMQAKAILNEKKELEKQLKDVQLHSVSDTEIASDCKQKLPRCQTSLDHCTKAGEILKLQVKSCQKTCPQAVNKAVLVEYDEQEEAQLRELMQSQQQQSQQRSFDPAQYDHLGESRQKLNTNLE